MHLTLGVVLNAQSRAALLSCRHLRNQVEKELIINLQVRYTNGVLIVKATPDLLKDLSDRSGDESSVLVVLHAAAHSEGLSSPGLSIDKHRCVKAVHRGAHQVLGAVLENILLARVMKDFIVFVAPLLLLIIHEAPMLVLGNTHVYMLTSYHH